MSLINFKKILSCSDEDQVHSAENLLKADPAKKWLSSKKPEERITCTIEFDKSSCISSIDIGNNGCSFIELLVSRLSSKTDDWTVLLPSTLLMTPKESRTNTNSQQTRSFKALHLNAKSLNEKWDRLKIICEQKFARNRPFGLNYIKLYSDDNKPIDIDDEDETETEQKKIGSFFAKKQLEKKTKSISNNTVQPKDEHVAQQVNKSISSLPHIMKNVVFVLSGFQNPLRAELRNKATAMGAVYHDDWSDKCTHLISAFPNTPKFIQVHKAGNGLIVNKQWILDCYDQSRLLPEKSYTFSQAPETKKRKLKDEGESSEKTPVKKKSISKKELSTGEIPDFFHDKHFYVSYGDYDDNTLLDITRVILAYDGILDRQITSDVTYVITNRMWNHDFEKISKSNPDINFVNLDWLQDCHDTNQFVPLQSYLIVP